MVAWEQQCPTMHHRSNMTKQPQRRRTPTPKPTVFWPRLEPEDYDALMREAKVVPLKFRKRLLRQDERSMPFIFP